MLSCINVIKTRIQPRGIVLAVLALFTLAMVCACHSNKINSPAKTADTRVGDAKISLPKDSSPTEVFTTRSASLIVKTGDTTPSDRFHRSLYSWEPGQQPKFIMGGHFLEVTCVSGDEFAATWYSENNEHGPVEFAALDARGLISQPLTLSPSGPTGWGRCDGDTRHVACIGNLPTMTADDKDYDEMGFSAVLVIDLDQQRTSWFPVKHQTYFHFNLAHKLIYVGDLTAPTMNSPVKAFDLLGHEQGTAKVWDVSLSPSGHFADSLQEARRWIRVVGDLRCRAEERATRI